MKYFLSTTIAAAVTSACWFISVPAANATIYHHDTDSTFKVGNYKFEEMSVIHEYRQNGGSSNQGGAVKPTAKPRGRKTGSATGGIADRPPIEIPTVLPAPQIDIGSTPVIDTGSTPAVSPVPIPATFPLLGLGLGALSLARRRRATRAHSY